MHDGALHDALKGDGLHRLDGYVLRDRVDIGVQKLLEVGLELAQVAADVFEDLPGRLVKAQDVQQVLEGQILVSALPCFADSCGQGYFQIALDHDSVSR